MTYTLETKLLKTNWKLYSMEYDGAVKPSVALPEGWVAFLDEDGAEYYFKPETGEYT